MTTAPMSAHVRPTAAEQSPCSVQFGSPIAWQRLLPSITLEQHSRPERTLIPTPAHVAANSKLNPHRFSPSRESFVHERETQSPGLVQESPGRPGNFGDGTQIPPRRVLERQSASSPTSDPLSARSSRVAAQTLSVQTPEMHSQRPASGPEQDSPTPPRFCGSSFRQRPCKQSISPRHSFDSRQAW